MATTPNHGFRRRALALVGMNFGEMPSEDGSTPSIDPRFLATVSKPTSLKAEAIRALRTHTMTQHFGQGHRALAVCAASEGVGCTYVASNLAVALSQTGINTILIDGDMRRPGIDKMFGVSRTPSGLRQCLSTSSGDFGPHIVAELLPNLSVMFAGGSAPDVPELLGGSRFDALINSCLRDFDAIIIDTPPANICSDANRIANAVSHALIVARRGVSLVNDVKMLAEQLKNDHAVVIGTVLNDP
jgi:protein-tyrosine kinase